MTFLSMLIKGDWKPIPNCPGRYVLRGVSPNLSISELFGQNITIYQFNTPLAKDPVFVACIEGGGMISYLRSGGKWVHTLCNDDGFKRKLQQIKINLVR
jgi:hypothetical protein